MSKTCKIFKLVATNLMWFWPCIVVSACKIKCQLNSTDWLLLQNFLFAQHVSSTSMPIIRSSRFIHMVAACATWRFDLQVVCSLLEQHPANRTHNPQLHTRPKTCKPKRQVPQAENISINTELLMMGIMVPETYWSKNKFCNKKTICCF